MYLLAIILDVILLIILKYFWLLAVCSITTVICIFTEQINQQKFVNIYFKLLTPT